MRFEKKPPPLREEYRNNQCGSIMGALRLRDFLTIILRAQETKKTDSDGKSKRRGIAGQDEISFSEARAANFGPPL